MFMTIANERRCFTVINETKLLIKTIIFCSVHFLLHNRSLQTYMLRRAASPIVTEKII